MKLTVDQKINSRHNNFDLLRLAGSFLVLLSHSLWLLHPVREDLLIRWTGGRLSMSRVGLIIFFSVSGYLVTESLLVSPTVYRYIWKRFIRIWPAYFVLTVVTVFILGPVVSTYLPAQYFANPLTWHFLLQNIFVLNNSRILPGVFNELDVNISAWTIPVEIRFYVMLLLLYLLRVFRYRWLHAIVFIVLVGIKLFLPYHYMQQQFHFNFTVWYDLGFYFITGSTLYVWRDRIKINITGIFVLSALWVITEVFHFAANAAAAVFSTYSVLYAGLKLPVFFKPSIDISYGIYLYSNPVLLTALWLTNKQLFLWQYLFLVVPIILLLGYVSWQVVERSALRLKNKAG